MLEDLDGKIGLVIDGGSTDIGVESTIVDLTQDPFCILRPGGVGIEELRRIIPQVGLYNKDVIIAEAVEEEGLGIAIMDRLRRAQGIKKNHV